MNGRIYYSREAELQAQRERVTLAVATAGVSMILGALIALLLMPRQRVDLRDALAGTAEELIANGRKVGERIVEDAAKRAEAVISR